MPLESYKARTHRSASNNLICCVSCPGFLRKCCARPPGREEKQTKEMNEKERCRPTFNAATAATATLAIPGHTVSPMFVRLREHERALCRGLTSMPGRTGESRQIYVNALLVRTLSTFVSSHTFGMSKDGRFFPNVPALRNRFVQDPVSVRERYRDYLTRDRTKQNR